MKGADVFTALADPTRRRVLDLLRTRERAAGEIVDAFPEQTQPGISRHLRILREAGLVDVRPEQQRRVYSLKTDGFRSLDAWLAKYERFWDASLDALEAHLDARAAARTKSTKGTTSTNRSRRKR